MNVVPLKQQELREKNIYTRDVDKLASTEFTFTRFLVPYLNNYEGWAIFCDCDMVFLTDAEEIFQQADPKYAVMCAQHDYTLKKEQKWTDNYSYSTQERIGVQWCCLIVDILATRN